MLCLKCRFYLIPAFEHTCLPRTQSTNVAENQPTWTSVREQGQNCKQRRSRFRMRPSCSPLCHPTQSTPRTPSQPPFEAPNRRTAIISTSISAISRFCYVGLGDISDENRTLFRKIRFGFPDGECGFGEARSGRGALPSCCECAPPAAAEQSLRLLAFSPHEKSFRVKIHSGVFHGFALLDWAWDVAILNWDGGFWWVLFYSMRWRTDQFLGLWFLKFLCCRKRLVARASITSTGFWTPEAVVPNYDIWSIR